MRLSEQSHGYQKTIILLTLVDTYPFLCAKCKEVRLSTVDALVGNSSGRRTIIRNDITSNGIRTVPGGAAVVRAQGAMPAQSTKRSQKGRIKSSTVAIYASIFVLLVAVIGVGYRAPQEQAAASTTVANRPETAETPAVNDVVATTVAAVAAQAADLAVAPNVAELAVATSVQSQYENTSSDSSTISKPTIVELSTATRDVASYVVQEGDTVSSVAAKFGLSTDTIKWANNLTGDSIAVGSNLKVLPRDGILYTVANDDTLESIATKYKADASLITTVNDLEINGLTTGLQIIVPGGVLPEKERPGYVAPRAAVTYTTGYSAGFGSGKTWFISKGIGAAGGYAYGNCTSYAFWRRAQLGMPVGTQWGNASSWARSATNAGYTVNNTPSVGAVMQNGGGYGHVAVVEAVLPNGDIQVSEMNAYVSGGGYNVVSGRMISAALAGQYAYIH